MAEQLEDPTSAPSLPGVTACSLCAGETLGDGASGRDRQLARLGRLSEEGLARVTFVECLDRCERGDVVVARPSVVGRARGGSPVWFERLAGEPADDALRTYLREGGPGIGDVPHALLPHRLGDRPG